jgi:hypothetical protein
MVTVRHCHRTRHKRRARGQSQKPNEGHFFLHRDSSFEEPIVQQNAKGPRKFKGVGDLLRMLDADVEKC